MLSNVAVTDLAAVIVSVQVLVPEQPAVPPQPANVEPAAGAAASTTFLPDTYVALQAPPSQVTEPLPAPVLVTVSA